MTKNSAPTQGLCEFCKKPFAKSGMSRHLGACSEYQARLLTPQGMTVDQLFHLLIEDRNNPSVYWMHLGVPGKSLLVDLDSFLRKIWLECCGHLSAFTIGDERYSSSPLWEDDEKESNIELKIEELLSPKLKFKYVYDFGSSTHLQLKVHDIYPSPAMEEILLLARNIAPVIPCSHCSDSATRVCSCCQETLCMRCADIHTCSINYGSEVILPLVNSPRSGVCGYASEYL